MSQHKLTFLFVLSIIVGVTTLVYVASPADAVTSRLGRELRSAEQADIAVDTAASSTYFGLNVQKGTVRIGQDSEASYRLGARLVINGYNGGNIQYDQKGNGNDNYLGKYGSAGDAIYAFASSTNSAIVAEQQNSSGYSIYSSGNGKNYFGGNVGIGVTTPTSTLEVRGEAGGPGGETIDLLTLSNAKYGSANAKASLLFQQADDNSGEIYPSGRITTGVEQTWDLSNPSTIDSYMAFQTVLNGTVAEKVRITSDGYVGIATTTPGYPLTVSGSSYFGGPIIMGGYGPVASSFLQLPGYITAPVTCSVSYAGAMYLDLQPTGYGDGINWDIPCMCIQVQGTGYVWRSMDNVNNSCD